MNTIDKTIDLLRKSTSPFHVVKQIEDELKENGFKELKENENYNLEKGGRYFVKWNSSSIIAFALNDTM